MGGWISEEVFLDFPVLEISVARSLEMRYKIIGGIQFYERKEIKDLLAYLRLIG